VKFFKVPKSRGTQKQGRYRGSNQRDLEEKKNRNKVSRSPQKKGRGNVGEGGVRQKRGLRNQKQKHPRGEGPWA